MEDIKLIIAKNLVMLRRRENMTQIELAERLNYTDKAISKWERGESVPDISVLKGIADLFGVTVDYLISEEHPQDEMGKSDEEKEREHKEFLYRRKRKHIMITGMSVMLVWLIAAIIFIPIDMATQNVVAHWLVFAYAVPVSALIWLIFNAIWFNRRRNFLIISLMMWSLLAAIHLSVLTSGHNFWQFYLLGIPGQLIIVLWSIIGKKVKNISE